MRQYRTFSGNALLLNLVTNRKFVYALYYSTYDLTD